MSNNYFRFKQFTIQQERAAMKVTTDACLFGAWAADEMRSISSIKNILDIGTGTGLLSLMVAQQVNAPIDAIDVDANAAIQAKENIGHSTWKERINVLQGDAKNYPFAGTYQVIVSNPPFYENELRSADKQKNTAHHDDGLTLKDLLNIIAAQLDDEGVFFLLLPYKRYREIVPAIQESGMKLGKICLVKQSTEHSFFRVMVSGGKKEFPGEVQEMAIKDDRDQYTTEFARLLKEYYLQF